MTQINRNPRERFRNPEDNADEPVKKKRRWKWKKGYLIAILAALVLAAGFTAYSYFTESFMFASDEGVIEEKIFNMDEFVLNLKDESGRRYIKTKLVLSYAEDKQVDLLDENVAQIRDGIIAILRGKTADEMMDVDRTEALKTEIRSAVNGLLGESIIVDVYFIDFMIQ